VVLPDPAPAPVIEPVQIQQPLPTPSFAEPPPVPNIPAATVARPPTTTAVVDKVNPPVPHESANDGLKWRKYGRKQLRNSAFPRDYYKCTVYGCNAKKQIERVVDAFGNHHFNTQYVESTPTIPQDSKTSW